MNLFGFVFLQEVAIWTTVVTNPQSILFIIIMMGHNHNFLSGLSPSATFQSGWTYLLGRGRNTCALFESPHTVYFNYIMHT